jgi:hypothetical protein
MIKEQDMLTDPVEAKESFHSINMLPICFAEELGFITYPFHADNHPEDTDYRKATRLSINSDKGTRYAY